MSPRTARDDPVPLSLALPSSPSITATLLQAEDRGSATAPVRELLEHESPAVRGRAALSLGRVGDPAAAPWLVGLLDDPVPRVAAVAAFALGRLEYGLSPRRGAGGREAVVEALAARSGTGGEAGRWAVWALGRLGGPEAGRAVGEVLDGPPVERSAADGAFLAAAIGAAGRLPGIRAGSLAPFVDAADPAVRHAAAHSLSRLDDPNTAPLLGGLLDDPDPRVRARAVRGLRDAPLRVAGERLEDLLDDEDWRVVVETLEWIRRAWSRDGVREPEGVGRVMRLSLGRRLHRRRLAIRALGTLAGAWPVAEDRVVRALADGEPAMRVAALEALADAGAEVAIRHRDRVRERYGLAGAVGSDGKLGEEAGISPASGAGSSPFELAAVARYLGAVGDADARATLRRLLGTGAPLVRAAALRQLAEVTPDLAARRAGEILRGSETPELQAVAAEVLERLALRGPLPEAPEPGPSWGRRLWRAQRRLERFDPVEPRLVILRAWSSIAPDLARQRTGLLLEDPRPVVRRWAYRELVGGRDLDPVADGEMDRRSPDGSVDAPELFAPRETGRGSADYRRLAECALELQDLRPRVRVRTRRGEFDLEIRPDLAPLTSLALLRWVRSGFYDGLAFHRVVPGFVVQAGDPTATGFGGAPETLPSEDGPVSYRTGTVGQALAGRNTGTSQWFVTQAPQPHLVGLYPVVGRVVEGQGTVDRIQPGDEMEPELVTVLPEGSACVAFLGPDDPAPSGSGIDAAGASP